MKKRQKPLAEFGEGLYPKQDADRAQDVYERISAVFAEQAKPTILGYIREWEDGSICACAVGALAISLGLTKRKTWRSKLGEDTVFTATVKMSALSAQELQSLEGGFMGWIASYHMKSTLFFEVGKRLREENL